MHFWIPPILFGLLTLAGVIGRPSWPGEILLSLLPQVGFASILIGLLLFGLGRPIQGVILITCAGVCVFYAKGMFSTPGNIQNPSSFRIYWANVFSKEDSFDRALSNAHKEKANIIVIAETPPIRTLANTSNYPPYHSIRGKIAGEDAAISVFSRIPLDNFEIINVEGRKSVTFDVTSYGETISFVVVHPTIPTTPSKTKRRNDHVQRSAIVLGRRKNRVLIGDFNTVPWSRTISNAEKLANVRRLPSSSASTWISTLPFLGLPLDLVFSSTNIDGHVRTGSAIGSDHFPLVVDLAIEPSVTSNTQN